MTYLEWLAVAGWLSIGAMTLAYVIGSAGRLRSVSRIGFSLGGAAAFAIVVLRFAEAF